MNRQEQYQVNGYSLEIVRNRLELQVIEAIRGIMPTLEQHCYCGLCLEDIYALSLNNLPAHYIQSGGLVLQPLRPDRTTVAHVVSAAVGQVAKKPRHD